VTSYRVVFRREALHHLDELFDYIADVGYLSDAAEYTDAIVTYCEGLANFPYRGVARDDIRPGLRTIGYRKRVVVAFAVVGDTVAILGVFYGGRDYETALSEPSSD
jgi:toxin ParE1/3/4